MDTEKYREECIYGCSRLDPCDTRLKTTIYVDTDKVYKRIRLPKFVKVRMSWHQKYAYDCPSMKIVSQTFVNAEEWKMINDDWFDSSIAHEVGIWIRNNLEALKSLADKKISILNFMDIMIPGVIEATKEQKENLINSLELKKKNLKEEAHKCLT